MSVFRIGLYRWGYEIYIPPGESPTGSAIRQRKRVLLKGVSEAEALAHVEKLRREAEAALRNSPGPPQALARKAAKGGSLQDALLLAWLCPREGLAPTKEGAKTYKYAAECVAALGATLPCANVDEAAYTYLRTHFAERGVTPCAGFKRNEALHRVLHFAQREGWIAERPALNRRYGAAGAKTGAPIRRPRITIRPPEGRTLRDALALAWECPQEGWSLKGTHGKAEHRRAAECIKALGETLQCVHVAGAHMNALRRAFDGQGLKAGVVEQRLQAFSRILYFAQREGWIAERPYWKRRNVYAKATPVLSEDQHRARVVDRRRTLIDRMQ